MRVSLRLALIASTLLAAPAAFAQASQAPATPAPTPPAAAATGGHYTTADTDLGTLLDDPAARAVLMRHIPAVISSEQINMARSMTLRGLQAYAGEALTDETLAAIDRDLAALPARH